jgi:hypothetical protein
VDGSPLLAIMIKNTAGKVRNGRVTVFEIGSKTYTKRLSKPEISFMRFLLDARARFVPSRTSVKEAPSSEGELLIGRS